ncbi:hypothetical protein FQA39_LY16999 [Lamprigera yunnana]|nr:hypothetical protein FQA39_LY16999 [Lamprigera yunnana]
MLWLLLIGALIIFYYYLSSSFQYWEKKNVPHPKPSMFFGNVSPLLTMTTSLGDLYTNFYNSFQNCSYVGYYRIRKPGLVIRDPQMVKNILNRDFHIFHDNELIIDETVDPIGSRNPFVLKGEMWKTVKNQVTPCFTTKKLKSMYVLAEDAAKKLVDYINTSTDASSSDGLEAKELFSKYSTEVVASCAFGLEGNTFNDPNSMFRKMGEKIFEPSLQNVLSTIVVLFLPSFTKLMKVGLLPKSVSDYFRNIVKETIRYRKENNIVRNDFLDFMLDMKTKNEQFTDVDITAHTVSFFTDGFETSSAMLSFLLYELATNQTTFKKLREEIDEALSQHGNLDYDSLNQLIYMDAVINESLRLHPPTGILLRMCTKPFKLPPAKPGGGDEVQVEVGTPVIIPVQGLHYDPQYFKDPLVYDPDRFLPENKEAIMKGTFLPFGDGPRSCHGQRFALMQIKVALMNIVRYFDIKVSNKTVVPLQIDPTSIVIRAKGGIWIQFFKR